MKNMDTISGILIQKLNEKKDRRVIYLQPFQNKKIHCSGF
jgi:hypothetical protein